MNPYTTRGQARIEHRDIAAMLQPDGIMAAARWPRLSGSAGIKPTPRWRGC